MINKRIINKIIIIILTLLFVVLPSENLVNTTSIEANTSWGIDVNLKQMIDDYAEHYWHDFWGVSLSQYKWWITLITLEEVNGRYAAHSQVGSENDDALGDRFTHIDNRFDQSSNRNPGGFRFSTGIGLFQLDRGGEQGDANEYWSFLPTIVKLNPQKSLLSVLRWHSDRFGDPNDWPLGVTLETFRNNSAWNGVKGSKVPADWQSITGKTWSEPDNCKNTELDISFNPPIVADQFENSVRYVGKTYWSLKGWEGYFPTWLIRANNGATFVQEYYYTYDVNKGLEEWVWNDPEHIAPEYVYRFEREYTRTQFPTLPDPLTTTNGYWAGGYFIARAGITDEKPALDPKNFIDTRFDIAININCSGSMSWNDPQDLRKDGAKVFVQQARNDDYLTVVEFSDSATVVFPLAPRTSNPAPIESAIDQIGIHNMTNIKGGIEKAYDQLKASSSGNRKAAIILTDGAHNVGDYGNAHQRFIQACWPIYTIGVYLPGSQELQEGEKLLKQIARETGGQYIRLENPNQLIQVYNQIARDILGGNTQLDTAIPILPGNTVNVAVNIPTGQSQSNFLADWTGSTIIMNLLSPSGTFIMPNTINSDIYHAKGLTYELYRITNPQNGLWTIILFGADLPPNGENVGIQVFTVPSQAPPTPVSVPSLSFWSIIATCSLLVIFLVFMSNKKKTPN